MSVNRKLKLSDSWILYDVSSLLAYEPFYVCIFAEYNRNCDDEMQGIQPWAPAGMGKGGGGKCPSLEMML